MTEGLLFNKLIIIYCNHFNLPSRDGKAFSLRRRWNAFAPYVFYILFALHTGVFLFENQNKPQGVSAGTPPADPCPSAVQKRRKNQNSLEILPSLRRMQFLHLVLAKCLTHNGTYILREAFPVISSGILIFLFSSFCKAELEQGSFAPESQNRNLKPSLCKGRWHALA